MFSHDSNLPRFDAHPQRHAWHVAAEAAGVLTAAAVLDAIPGVIDRIHQSRVEAEKPPEPIVFESRSGANRAVLLYSGCDQECGQEAKKAAKVFGDLAHVVTPVYGKYSISPEIIAKQTISACEDLGVDEIVIFGNSMGLGIALRTALQPIFRKRFPEARAVIGNAGVVEYSDIAFGCRAALRAAQTVRYSFTTNRAYEAAYKLSRNPRTVAGLKIKLPKIPTMPPKEISRYAHAITDHLPDGCLRGFVDPTTLWFIDNQPGTEYQDPVAKTWESYRDVERVMGSSPQVVADPQRPPHSHMASLRFPKIPRELVEWSFYPKRRPNTHLHAA